MSADQPAEPARTYTKVERADKTTIYECNLCGDQAPDLDGARAHRAVHVAGPDLLSACKVARDEYPEKCAGTAAILDAAIAKAEPKG